MPGSSRGCRIVRQAPSVHLAYPLYRPGRPRRPRSRTTIRRPPASGCQSSLSPAGSEITVPHDVPGSVLVRIPITRPRGGDAVILEDSGARQPCLLRCPSVRAAVLSATLPGRSAGHLHAACCVQPKLGWQCGPRRGRGGSAAVASGWPVMHIGVRHPYIAAILSPVSFTSPVTCAGLSPTAAAAASLLGLRITARNSDRAHRQYRTGGAGYTEGLCRLPWFRQWPALRLGGASRHRGRGAAATDRPARWALRLRGRCPSGIPDPQER